MIKNMTVEMKTDGANETRECLLNAALIVFSRKGFAATKLEDIAMESGHTRGAISFHFKNKFNIFQTALIQSIRGAINSEYFLLYAGYTPLETMEKLIDLMCQDAELRSRQVRIFNSLFMEEPLGMESLIEEVELLFRKTFKAHEDVLSQGINEGLFRKDINVQFEAKSFYNWFWGYYTNLKRFFDEDECEMVKNQARKFFIDRLQI